MKPLNCFICCTKTTFYCKNIFMLTTKHSDVSIISLIEKFLENSIVDLIIDEPDTSIICQDCLTKIDEYDQAAATALRIENELRDLLLQNFQQSLSSSLKIEFNMDSTEINTGFKDAKKHASITNKCITMKCKVCDETFGSMTAMASHRHDQIPEEISDLKIENEGDFDDCFYNLQNDMIMQEYVSDTIEKTKSPPSKRKKPPKITYSCKMCTSEFTSKSELSEHIKIHDNLIRCADCGTLCKTQDELDAHIAKHKGKNPLHCVECGKVFTKRATLVRHMPIHTGETFFQCDQCGKEFVHHSSFRMHVMAHKDIREKACPTCGLTFRSTSHLNRHIRIHTGAKPYACPVCDQKFAQRYNMMTHYRVHQGIERPTKKTYPCTICNATFPRAIKLSEHLQRIHDDAIYGNSIVLV